MDLEPNGDPPVPRGLTRWAPAAVVACAVLVGIWAVARERGEIADALHQLHWWSVPLSFVACFAGLLAIFRSWACLLSDTGADVDLRAALRIYAIGQAGKYVPGSVWSIVSQVQLGREYGISRVRMASASLVALLVSVTVAIAAGCLLLPFSGGEAMSRYWFAPLVAVLFAALLWPPVLNVALGWAGRLVRSPGDHSHSGSAIATSAGWAVLANLLFGVHVMAIAQGLGVNGVRGYLLSTCAYALAAGLGVIVVLAPAGAGVREAVMTVVLAPALTLGQALTVALASRFVATAVDLTFALSQLRRSRGAAEREPVFVTRRFPPSVGGMETLAAGVWRALQSSRPNAILLAHGGTNRGLVWWYPTAVLRLGWLVARRRVSYVLTGDAPTFAIVEPLLRLVRVPRATMILGLDVTFENPIYRATVLRSLRRAPQVIAISNATRAAAASTGVADDRLRVLRLGVQVPEAGQRERAEAREALVSGLGLQPHDTVLLTLGRLVRRKGACWFVGEVLPRLPETTHYLIAGDGPERERIVEAASEASVSSRVHLLGSVSDEEREQLMRGCDMFVQPNVRVEGDMEGFGLVTIEAAMRGTVVAAADLEGIKDAVIPDRTGFLLASEDVASWTSLIVAQTADRAALAVTGARFQAEAIKLFGEEQMARQLSEYLGLVAPAATLG